MADTPNLPNVRAPAGKMRSGNRPDEDWTALNTGVHSHIKYRASERQQNDSASKSFCEQFHSQLAAKFPELVAEAELNMLKHTQLNLQAL
ncbi:hypothetical protein ABVK25_010473 [Lepraria finkii]|uniref:Uncharacterized protein n=1 Tax=Lepraria finkii TaxID=1340010 RepID=A0ABR4AUC4_9LECA